MKNKLKKIIKRIIKPVFIYSIIKPTKPISDWHGFDRGTPVDRFYIENFLEKNKSKITGNCLEFLNNDYTIKFGSNVIKSDVIDIDPKNTKATIISDVKNMINIEDNHYDCIIMTQVLNFIDEVELAIKETHRILKPGGVVLITTPFINRMDKYSGPDLDYWRFSKKGLEHLLLKQFQSENTTVESCGNIYGGIMNFIGATIEDSSKNKLEKHDENFPVIVSAVAKK